MKANILIVDDMESNRVLLETLVGSIGHIPILAEDGLAAMKQMEKQPPDIVLLDILMPEMNGHEVLERMKNIDVLRHIPVIVVSAVDEIESVVKCIEEGADDYITKPVDHILLKARIVACLEKKQLLDQEKKLYTELAEKHEALQKAERARDAMAHMIVHDLNNLLTIIIGNLQIMQSDMTDNTLDEKMLEGYLKTLNNTAGEMSSFIISILDVSKLESGDMPVYLTSINASQVLENLYEQFNPLAGKKNVRLSNKSGPADIMARADTTLLTRILQNLMNNAFKHTPENTDVTMSVEGDGENIVFCIEDCGLGIAEEYRDSIFEKFFQIENNNKAMGVGLGLTFCKMAAEAQGGKIWIESREGKGSCFKVMLEAAR